MNGAKMSKNFFFQMIEKRLEELTEEVKQLKVDETSILFGRVMELSRINSMAMDVDYWRYSEIDKKITALKDKI